MKKKSIMRRMIPLAFLVIVLGELVYLGYLLWGRPEAAPRYTAEIIRNENTGTDHIILDNGFLHLDMDPITTQFELTDQFGHVWKSNPFADPETSGETIASGENRNALASTLNVYYRLARKAVDNMYDNYSYSISRSAYEIKKIDDFNVAVTYAIGDIPREYIIPDALTKNRYDELSDAVKKSGSSKKKFTGKFSSLESGSVLKDLRSENDNTKQTAVGNINSFPQLATQDIYVNTASDNNNMKALETILSAINYSENDKLLDLILTRSTYKYAYQYYTPEDIAALQSGTEEEQQLAVRLLEANASFTETPGFILQREERILTPVFIEMLQNGDEEQQDYAKELISKYPSIQTDEATVIALSDEERQKFYTIEEILDEETYSAAEQLLERSLFEAAEKNVPILFNVTVYYRLVGENFIAEVPYNEMTLNSANASLSYISLLPMFGAVGMQEDGSYEDGYILVPEGGGALIRFNNQKFSQTGYYADVYGYDWGIKRHEVITESKAVFPVFGILRNEQSFFCSVEDGSAFVSIQADINGNTTGTSRSSYNYVNAKSQVMHTDQYNVSAKTAELQIVNEKTIPDVVLTQRYCFIDNGDYSKLAVAYGDYLQAQYPALKEKQSSEDIPVSIELIGAIDKKVVQAGIPVKTVVPTTTFSQGLDLLTALKNAGIANLNVRYTGWLRGGVQQKVLNGINVLNELDGEKGLSHLIESTRSKEIPLYFDGITALAYDSGILDGFLASRDAARHITREEAKIPHYSPVYYTEEDEKDFYYLTRPDYAQKKASNLINYLKNKEAGGISFRDIGTMLSADYDPSRTTNRETVKNMNIETLKEAQNAGEKIMIKEGFDFTLPFANIITDMDLSGVRYLILDRFIPFYQIAIHGTIDYTGQPLNLKGDYQTEMLRSIEYGAGLNFAFISADASITQETRYTGLYGASFSSWERTAIDAILRYQQEAASLNQQRIVRHEELNEYIKVTTYEDGTEVYVNYGTEDYYDGIMVPARDYAIVRKGDK